jgi:MFS family permease
MVLRYDHANLAPPEPILADGFAGSPLFLRSAIPIAKDEWPMNRSRASLALCVLFAINAINFFDRQIGGVLSEPIRKEWGLTDVQVGWLVTAFTLLYAATGVPLGRLADRANRTRILAAGVFFWSLMTAVSGLTRTFGQLFVVRLGVGVGEATCAPASASLIGDFYPPHQRARALSVFMMGLPIGLALSYLVSSQVAATYGWRPAFFVAGIPGLVCALAALALREPARGAKEIHAAVGARQRAGSPYLLVLATPTMCWLIVSGALHNFNMYALSAFQMPYLMRYHGATLAGAGRLSTILALAGIPGLLLGGIVGDLARRARPNGRLLVAGLALLICTPFTYLALRSAPGDWMGYGVFMALGGGLMFVYYSTVYSTIQDVIEPSLRGTAMALYFFAMYVFGASFGPVVTGFLSEHYTRGAATVAGVVTFTKDALEPFRAAGLHTAMYLIPVLCGLLALVLMAASFTVRNDMDKLHAWMRELDHTTVADDPVAQPMRQAAGK